MSRTPRPSAPVGRKVAIARQLALAAACLLAGGASAEEASAWRISGFGSAGITAQSGADGWGFLRSSSQLGASESVSATQDSRLGVQLNWRHDARWDAALQAVAVHKPAGTPMVESIESAYVGYRPTPNTHLRLGRTSPDIFLFSDSRNVGYVYPWARPPVDFYGFAPVGSINGIDLNQRWHQGDVLWRARATAGSFGISVIRQSDGKRIPIQGRDALVLSLAREQGNLLLKASYFDARLNAGLSSGLAQLRQGLTQLSALPVPGLAESIAPLQTNLWSQGGVRYISLGSQWDNGPWTAIGEYSDLDIPKSPLGAQRAYASLGYRYQRVTFYGLASRVLPKKPPATAPDLQALAPMIGPAAAAQAQQLVDFTADAGAMLRFDQSTFGVGMRWDWASCCALKLQVDRFQVQAYGSGGWFNNDPRPAKGILASAVLDFVWGQ
jgi:hypothetical protein